MKKPVVLKTTPTLNIDIIAEYTHLAENPENHKRTKHIRTGRFVMRELVSEDEVKEKHIQTGFQLADCLTKPFIVLFCGFNMD